MTKQWVFPVVFGTTIFGAIAIRVAGWRADDWRVEWLCTALIIGMLSWAAVRFAGHHPRTSAPRGPLHGLCVTVTVSDVTRSFLDVRGAMAGALRDLLVADGADTQVPAAAESPAYELEVLDVTLEHRAGSVSLTGGRDSPYDRYGAVVRLVSPTVPMGGTRAVYVNVPPSDGAVRIGKRLAYDVLRRLIVVHGESVPRLTWDNRARFGSSRRVRRAS
jgi:hypothetical protein